MTDFINYLPNPLPDRPLLEQNVPHSRGLLVDRPVDGDLLSSPANGVPDGGTDRLGSRVPSHAHLVRVHRVRAEEVVRAVDGAEDLQDATGLGLCMTVWRERVA